MQYTQEMERVAKKFYQATAVAASELLYMTNTNTNTNTQELQRGERRFIKRLWLLQVRFYVQTTFAEEYCSIQKLSPECTFFTLDKEKFAFILFKQN